VHAVLCTAEVRLRVHGLIRGRIHAALTNGALLATGSRATQLQNWALQSAGIGHARMQEDGGNALLARCLRECRIGALSAKELDSLKLLLPQGGQQEGALQWQLRSDLVMSEAKRKGRQSRQAEMLQKCMD